MLGIQYYKADSSTYVIRTAQGQTKSAGRGLSFFYNAATTSIAAVPVSAQEAPAIVQRLKEQVHGYTART